jgi:RNA polymerase sigma-70 factor (ECF subfamily)
LHRAFLESRRRQTRFPHHELEEVKHELPVHSPEFAIQVDCSQVLPALAKVDEVYRAAVALYYLEDCPYSDIAAILEVPLGTVKSRIARGIAQLREILLSQEITLPRPQAEAQSTKGSARLGNGEWDFSSTRLRELPGAA